MASTNPFSPAMSDHGDDWTRHDTHVDTAFAKDGSTAYQYANEPWNHCNDAVKCYPSLRMNQRSQFMAQLDGSANHHIAQEKSRVKKMRNNYLSQPSKRRLMDELHDQKRQWKNKVIDDLPSIRQKELQVQFNSTDHTPRNWNEAHYARLLHWGTERAAGISTVNNREQSRSSPIVSPPIPSIFLESENDAQPTNLNHVPELPHEPNSSGTDNANHTVDPYYGFKACAIYFKKNADGTLSGCQSPMDKSKRKFPNEKISIEDILGDSDESPLSIPCEKNMVRYFHFPSNNMKWIEVSFYCYHSFGIF